MLMLTFLFEALFIPIGLGLGVLIQSFMQGSPSHLFVNGPYKSLWTWLAVWNCLVWLPPIPIVMIIVTLNAPSSLAVWFLEKYASSASLITHVLQALIHLIFAI